MTKAANGGYSSGGRITEGWTGSSTKRCQDMEWQGLSWLIGLKQEGTHCMTLLISAVDDPWVRDDVEAVDGPGLNIVKIGFIGVGLLPLIGMVLLSTRPT
jgi:hypothetical protein